MIGLYAIVHVPTNRAYLGSSIDIKRRLKEHMTDLRHSRHHCSYLQNAWLKYGKQQFEVRLPTTVGNLSEARELEQAFLDCFMDKLFNTKPTAIGGAYGDYSAARKPNWHMKTVMQRLTPEERKALYGKTKGSKREGAAYVVGAAKRLADPNFRSKLSAACKGKRQVLECPHCGIQGGGGNMQRYHFDKCKGKK